MRKNSKNYVETLNELFNEQAERCNIEACGHGERVSRAICRKYLACGEVFIYHDDIKDYFKEIGLGVSYQRMSNDQRWEFYLSNFSYHLLRWYKNGSKSN